MVIKVTNLEKVKIVFRHLRFLLSFFLFYFLVYMFVNSLLYPSLHLLFFSAELIECGLEHLHTTF